MPKTSNSIPTKIKKNKNITVFFWLEFNKKINLKLVEILKQVFKIDKSDYPIIVTIDPNLTEAKLDLLIKQARTIILNLYIKY